MNTMATPIRDARVQRLSQGAVLLLGVVVLGFAALKFHPLIHFMFGGLWMILSAAALTVSAIDYLSGAKHFKHDW